MKNYFLIMAVAMVMSFSSCQQKEQPSNTHKDLIGVYQYVDGREGMSVITDKYFIAGAKWSHEPSPVDAEDYYEKEYKSMIFEAGTWTMQDTIVTCNLFFGKDPSNQGGSFRWSYSFKGDTMIFHIINKNNEVRGTGRVVKMKPSNVQDDITGVYKNFDNADFEDISVLTEGYFIFTGRYNHRFATVDSTDPYVNKYKSLFFQAGTYTVQDSIVTSTLLYTKNPSQVGTSYRWAYKFTGDTVATGFVNEHGEVVNWSDYNIRLE